MAIRLDIRGREGAAVERLASLPVESRWGRRVAMFAASLLVGLCAAPGSVAAKPTAMPVTSPIAPGGVGAPAVSGRDDAASWSQPPRRLERAAMSRARLLVRTSLCIGLAVFAAACSKASDAWSFERRLAVVTKHAEAAMQCVRERWSRHDNYWTALERLGNKFDEALDGIAEVTDDPLLEYARTHEASDPTAKLIVMADYFREDDDRIREIAKHFLDVEWNPRDHVPPESPPVTEDWARRDDRLAWEYLLLRPSGLTAPSDPLYFQSRVVDAICQIGDPASAQAFKLLMQSSLTEIAEPGGHRNDRLRTVARGVFRIPSRASLEALLDLLAWITNGSRLPPTEGTGEEEMQPPEPLTVLRHIPSQELKWTLLHDKQGQWRSALEEFAKMATPEHKAMLVEILLATPFDEIVRIQERARRRARQHGK